MGLCQVREHPAPSGALRPRPPTSRTLLRGSQGAPSTIRCIETSRTSPGTRTRRRVREHPAPSGALRQIVGELLGIIDSGSQGAPSTIRCIEAPLRVRASAWVCRRLPGTMGAEGTGTRNGGRSGRLSERGSACGGWDGCAQTVWGSGGGGVWGVTIVGE